jgi:hypothetical protein
MKSYPEQIADILRNAPRVPSFERESEPASPHISKETQAKLIAVHAAYATFGHREIPQTQRW